MDKVTNYFKGVLEAKGIQISESSRKLLERLAQTPELKDAIDSITQIQEKMINIFKRNNRIEEFKNAMLSLPNATVGKSYFHQFDTSNPLFKDIRIIEITSQDLTIDFDKEKNTISSVFTEAGQFLLQIKYNLLEDEINELVALKEVKLLVNPDPKSLWKNLDSDKNDPYWKEDNISSSSFIGDRKFIAGSKRGRSHAHEGIFRDDDFGYGYSPETGWGIIVVADGAGSAKYSRKGSHIACQAVVEYFSKLEHTELLILSDLINAELQESNEQHQKGISSFCISHLGKAAFAALGSIKQEASSKQAEVKDYSTTLIFTFFKEFGDKMFVSSFWVGDGGIGIYLKDSNTVHLLGTPDSGEFSGQTRFLTMSEIFADNAYINRIKFKIVDKNARLVLMTDGITDAKFQTDAALEKHEVWKGFMDDLEGLNEENQKINFDGELTEAESDLMKWMDFWSAGNHDDRTLAILY